MWKDLAASWAILLGIGFMMLANGLQGTLLGLRATLEGFSTFTTGIMMSGYFIGILFLGHRCRVCEDSGIYPDSDYLARWH